MRTPDARNRQLADAVVLVIEDGDEYLENLQRFVGADADGAGPRYLQAHCGQEALAHLATGAIDLIVLDMRFDRTPRALLLGDPAQAARENGGDAERGWRHLSHHQGLYVLAALRTAGHAALPVLIAYDFSREIRRFEFLRQHHPRLDWLPDAVTAGELRRRMALLV